MHLSSGKKFFLLLFISFIVCCIFFIPPFFNDRDERLSITMLNVGQGDSFYIRFLDGSDMLIDAGADERVVHELSAVMPWWDDHIDTIILTHPDSDHIGGFIAVLDQYSITRAFDCGLRSKKTRVVENVYAAIERHKVELQAAHAGDILQASSGETVLMVSPEHNAVQSADDANACSLVMRIMDHDATALLTGDASIAIESVLISRYNELLDIDLLKVGHHGSNTSTSQEFLEALTPSVALVSAGVRNRYHHPHPSVIQRLSDFGAHIFNTAIDGRVRCVSDKNVFICS